MQEISNNKNSASTSLIRLDRSVITQHNKWNVYPSSKIIQVIESFNSKKIPIKTRLMKEILDMHSISK